MAPVPFCFEIRGSPSPQIKIKGISGFSLLSWCCVLHSSTGCFCGGGFVTETAVTNGGYKRQLTAVTNGSCGPMSVGVLGGLWGATLLTTYLSIYLSIYPSIYLSIYLSRGWGLGISEVCPPQASKFLALYRCHSGNICVHLRQSRHQLRWGGDLRRRCRSVHA